MYNWAFLAFDAATLKLSRTLRLPVLNPPLSDQRYGQWSSYFCTDSGGVIYMSLAESIYVLDPMTGLQTGHFTLPVMDRVPADRGHSGYYIGFRRSISALSGRQVTRKASHGGRRSM